MAEMAENPPLLLPSLPIETVHRASSKCSLSCRYSLTILTMLGFCVMYSSRVNLSVALVAMVNSTDDNVGDGLHNATCRADGCDNALTKTGAQAKKFNWDEETQGIILGAFFYGFLVTQIPGGWIASKYGGKVTFGLGVFSTSLLILLTPFAANHGVGALIAVRVLQGLGQGVTYPSMQVLMSSWAPPLERSKLTSIAIAGCDAGNIIAQPIAGLLCQSNFLGGWPSVFYVFGSVAILWCIAWAVLVYEKPTNHPRITEEEKEYILSSIGKSQDKILKKHYVPWLAILSSPPAYAIFITYFTLNWGYYTFLTSLPTYFKEILGFKILENGIISAVPYICNFTFEISASVLADWLISSGSGIADVRKVFTICASLIPAFLLISASYVGSVEKPLAVVLIAVSMGFNSISASGFAVNPLDIAPRYVGIICGIGNTFGTIPGIVAPFVVGWLTKGKPTRHQWQKVFYITAIIYVLGALAFAVLGKGEEQPWNTPNDEPLLPAEVKRESRPDLATDKYPKSSINTVTI